MRRNYLKVGDVASNGATIIEGIDKVKYHGVHLTYLYAKVRCPACNTIGIIVPWGPRRRGKLMGKEPALHNDLCACKCDPKPHLIASQSGMFMTFQPQELAAMGFSSTGMLLPKSSLPAAPADQDLAESTGTIQRLALAVNRQPIVHISTAQRVGSTHRRVFTSHEML